MEFYRNVYYCLKRSQVVNIWRFSGMHERSLVKKGIDHFDFFLNTRINNKPKTLNSLILFISGFSQNLWQSQWAMVLSERRLKKKIIHLSFKNFKRFLKICGNLLIYWFVELSLSNLIFWKYLIIKKQKIRCKGSFL